MRSPTLEHLIGLLREEQISTIGIEWKMVNLYQFYYQIIYEKQCWRTYKNLIIKS